MRKRIGVPVIVILWLLIGLVAAAQRGYINTDHDCASFGSTLLTIVVGPLNYVNGVNPDVECDLPEPSE